MENRHFHNLSAFTPLCLGQSAKHIRRYSNQQQREVLSTSRCRFAN